MKWFLVDHNWMEGAWNMAVDEAIFRIASGTQAELPTLRLYGFSRPTVTVGYAQRDVEQYKKRGISLCRRITGGGTVFHGTDLTYSIVAPVCASSFFDNVSSSYKIVHEVVRDAFLRSGFWLELCESHDPRCEQKDECFLNPVRHDLLYDGCKVAGAAQRRRDNYFLHQGSVELKYFLKTKSHYPAFFYRIKKFLIEGFKTRFDCEFEKKCLSVQEEAEARNLYSEKYREPLWNEQCRVSSLSFGT